MDGSFFMVYKLSNWELITKEGIMRKGLIVLLAAVVAVAFAMPAMADLIPTNVKVSGFYRSKAWLSNFHDGGGGPSLRDSDTEQTNAYVEQRARVKFAFGNENVQAVFYFESDMLWGDSSATVGRNQGGALGADSIQLETKNIHVWFKIPDTSIKATIGLQAFPDAYAGVLFSGGGSDAAGITVTGKYEPVSYKIAWAKLFGDLSSEVQYSNDTDLYILEADFAPKKDVKLGLNFYFLKDSSAKINPKMDTSATAGDGVFGGVNSDYKLNLYVPGVDVAFNAGPVKMTGFLFYQTGTFEALSSGVSDIDVSAYGADLRGTMKVGPGTGFIEGLYLSGGDKSDKYEAPITLGDFQGGGTATGPGGYSGFSRTRMQILLPSWDTINVSQCLIGCSGGEYGDSPGNNGRGIWHIAAGYAMDVSPKVKVEGNIGYLSATKLLSTDSYRDKDFGTEINAGMHYNVTKGLDVGLFGAYVFLGDFVTDPPSGGVNAKSFEDPWSTYARVNYSF